MEVGAVSQAEAAMAEGSGGEDGWEDFLRSYYSGLAQKVKYTALGHQFVFGNPFFKAGLFR